MNLKKFVASLGRGFSRQKLVEHLLLVNQEINKSTVPGLELFLEQVPQSALNAGALGRNSKEFFKHVKPYKRAKHMFEHMKNLLEDLTKMSGEIEDEIGKYISKTDSAETLSYKGAILVQYVQLLQFVSDYTRSMMLTYTEIVNNETGKGTVKFTSGLTDYEREWVVANNPNFHKATAALTKVVQNLKKDLSNVPDLVVQLSDEVSTVAIHGQHNLDPFDFTIVGNESKQRARSGLIFTSPAFSIIYHVRMMFADWQISRFKKAEEERQALEYRIQALKDSLEGQSNPKIERAIEVHTERLTEVNWKLNKMRGEVDDRE